MADPRPPLSSPDDFATWEPVLRLLLTGDTERRAGRPARVAGRIGPYGWSLAHRGSVPPAARAAVEGIRRTLARGGDKGDIAFRAEVRPDGGTALALVRPSPAVEPAVGSAELGVLLLAEGALPEPWLRRPGPVPGARPAPTADPELLERTLRARLPGSVGATEAEIAAAEARLGVPLTDELKALHRVARVDWIAGFDEAVRAGGAVGCELGSLDDLRGVDGALRFTGWGFGATRAVRTASDAAVQDLAGAPTWIDFGGNGGDRFAVDLTPGPDGYLGQVILIDHEQSLGAELVADSLTDFVLGRRREDDRVRRDGFPAVARVGAGGLESVEAAARPALEVLHLCDDDGDGGGGGGGGGTPYRLVPVLGLPRLRTLTAAPGTLADPLEVAGIPGLEYLETGAREWRVLLDAGAVPRTLKAAAVAERDRCRCRCRDRDWGRDHLSVLDLADEILALRDRPPFVRTLVEGNLGPAV
jgi:cell wall assembly regulator SMI1